MNDDEEQQLLDRVREVWAEVLDVEVAPLDVNFLDAGGSSLLMIMLWEQLQELTERTLKVSDLFEHATVRAQAALLCAHETVRAPAAVPARDQSALVGRARRGAP